MTDIPFHQIIDTVRRYDVRSEQFTTLARFMTMLNDRHEANNTLNDANIVIDTIINKHGTEYNLAENVAKTFNKEMYEHDGMPVLGYGAYFSQYINGGIIALIKEHRSRTGNGLADSKMAVEQAINEFTDAMRAMRESNK